MNVGRYRITDHCRHALQHLFFPDHKFHLQPLARQAPPDLLAMMHWAAAGLVADPPSAGWACVVAAGQRSLHRLWVAQRHL